MDLTIQFSKYNEHTSLLTFQSFKAFFRIVSSSYIMYSIHIIFTVIIHTLIIFSPDDRNPVASMSEGGILKPQICGWSSNRLHKEPTLRLIPEWYEVPTVLIHLLSRIMWRRGSWLCIWCNAMTILPVCMHPSLLQCSATGDFSVLLCATLKLWLLTLRYSGYPRQDFVRNGHWN